jgi:[CysO sulfur-carrier protein]-S-L-cysteine hydrolase
MVIAADLLEEIVAHARAEYDAECCGMVAYEDGGDGDSPRATRVHRAVNIFAATPGGHSPSARSPGMASKRFEIDGKELLRTLNEFEAEGWELGAIYHSHTHTAPYPSQTDINFAANWPGLEWVIVGLAGEEPEVRCYLIDGPEVQEVALEVR